MLFDEKSIVNEIPMKYIIRRANSSDVPAMVLLSHEKRMNYEKTQPQLWRHAEGAEEAQTKWFSELMEQEDHILLIAESENTIVGFVIGGIIKAPEVYDPSGLTLMVDDFCVSSTGHWQSVGNKLLVELQRLAKTEGATQILVVCGAHDEPKRQFMKDARLTIASEWYVGEI